MFFDNFYFFLLSFFNIDRNTRHWERINEGLNRFCARRYSDNKSTLHKYFKDHGGIDNADRARRNRPLRLRHEAWNRLIDDVFLNPNWQGRSKQNSNNRIFKKMNPETQQTQGAIDTWHD